MAAIGCLLPVVLLVAGAAVGGVVGGTTTTGLWGGGIGCVAGLVLMMVVFWAFERARDNMPQ